MTKNTKILTKDDYLKLCLQLFRSYAGHDISFNEFMSALRIITNQYRKDYQNGNA